MHLDCKASAGMGRPTFRPFGIAEDTQHMYIASNGVIGKYDKATYEFKGYVDVPLYVNTHQILKDKTKLYVCNTAINTIGIYDEVAKSYNHFDLITLALTSTNKKPRNVYEYDINHVNTLFDAGDKIWFCLHNRGYRPSEFGWFDKTTFESKIEIAAGFECHGIHIEGDTLYTLSTGTGELLQIDIPTKREIAYPLLGTATFLRGLAAWNSKLVFGGSVNFKLKNESKSCVLGVFDINTKQFELIDLPTITCINDLKLINV
jgi:hypothetical protein